MKNSLRLTVHPICVPPIREPLAALAAAVLLLASTPAARAGVLYQDPTGGWDLIYTGDAAACGDVANLGIGALDGNWQHNQSDKWDCSAPGGTLGPSNAPGGIVSLTEGDTTYLRLQDTGNPKDWSIPDPSNRRFYFGHDMMTEHPDLTSPLTHGITISFRARISTSTATDPNDPFFLDEIYPDLVDNEPEFPALTEITPWPAVGKGYNVKDDAKGMFTVQEDGAHAMGFALALDIDTIDGVGGGLIMDNAPPANLPGTDHVGSPAQQNIVPFSDASLTQWHEFWITIQGTGTTGGILNYPIYRVDVYTDGVTSPTTFMAEGSIGAEFPAPGQFLCFGLPSESSFGAVDVDFYAYKLGVIQPVPEPAAAAAGLAAVASLSLLSRRRGLRSRS